jgi:hypothetical protein
MNIPNAARYPISIGKEKTYASSVIAWTSFIDSASSVLILSLLFQRGVSGGAHLPPIGFRPVI